MMYYSIKDILADNFLPTFTAENDNVARRIFTATINDEENKVVNQNAQDFQLFRIAEWDKAAGELIANKCLICDGNSVKRG